MARLIDVSNNQGFIDWKKVARVGRLWPAIKIRGAYLKATEGVNFNDSRFFTYRLAAQGEGIKVGAYHFARPDNNTPEREADHFYSRVGRPQVGQLRPVLDFETGGHTGAANAEAWARRFCKRYHALTGVWPLFYSYPYFIRGISADTPIGGGLWLANYGINDGKRHKVAVPFPWKKIKLH